MTIIDNLCIKIKTAKERGDKTGAIFSLLTREEKTILVILYACRFYVSTYLLIYMVWWSGLPGACGELCCNEACGVSQQLTKTHCLIHDLKMLKVKDNELYRHFEAGFFTVMKSKTAFSKMAYDQCHEQNNKVMKSKSGIVDLLNKEDTAFLRRLELASPEIQEYLHEIENVEDKQARPHKEASPTFVLKYIGDCRAVYNRFTTNPFLDTQFQKLNTTAFFPECIVEDAGRVFALGKEQYADFKETRFILGSADVIKTSIPRNSLKLPSSARKVQIESPQIKLTASTIIKLRNACINRESPAKDIFKSEFTGKTIIYYYYYCTCTCIRMCPDLCS